MDDLGPRKKNLPLPPMTSLPVFEVVGQYLSVARAAEVLNLTPGAVSRQIQNLERYLGTALFVRNHRRMIFTPEGEEYWGRVNGALGELRDATRTTSSRVEDAPLTIVVPRMFLQRIIMPRLSDFYAHYPDIKIKFLTSGVGAVPVDGSIAISPERREGYRYDMLAEANLTPVCSPRYLEASPPLLKRLDLGQHTLLRSRDYMHNWENWLAEDAPQVLSQARCIDFESPGLELTGAVEGLGITIVRIALVQEEINAGKLVPLLHEHMVHAHYLFGFSDVRRRSQNFSNFRNWLKLNV